MSGVVPGSHGERAQVADGGEHPLGGVEGEAAVGVARHQAVRDQVPVVKVEGDLISYSLALGNADGCIALDTLKGVILTICDLRTKCKLLRYLCKVVARQASPPVLPTLTA